ncbi:hypothetical protein DFH07DRAFT_775117 [Mycena maculata]|uniref:Protein CPL1-like domain-containing protein n=1 Tax=Mycena maculata TaxID=230809 RepID=A0AAD7N8Q1_9AGAR|nr:hypothetical protein DFH07DRAFT_775117 [Mycena maculata]
MRFASTLIVSSLVALILPLVSAIHPVPHSPSRNLGRLQHHEKRDLIDVCVSIPSLTADLLSLLGLNIQLCLCLKDLNLYLDTLDDVDLRGIANTTIQALVGEQGDSAKCAPLPPHAHRECTYGNPCAFQCDSGYTLQGGQCVSNSGPSAIPRSLKPRAAPITTLKDAQEHCKTLKGDRTTVCGVQDAKGPFDFECVNTETEFDSCGGCVTPHPFTSEFTLPTGRDCGRITNALNAKCEKSKCIVQCHSGYTFTGGKCVANGQKKMHKSRRGVDVTGNILGITLGSSTSSHVSDTTPMLNSDATVAVMKVINKTQALSTTTPPPNAPSSDLCLLSIYKLLGSKAVPDVAANAAAAVNATANLQTELKTCGCAPDLEQIVDNLLDALLALLDLCDGEAPVVPGPDPNTCLTVSLTKLVCSILPDVYIGPIVLCGLLGPGLTADVQSLLNGLGIGLTRRKLASCPAGPALPPAGTDATPTPTASSSASASATPSASSFAASAPAATASASASAGVAPPTAGDPSTIVINLLGIVVNTTLSIGDAVPGTCSSGLVSTVGALVDAILSPSLLDTDGPLLDGLLTIGGSDPAISVLGRRDLLSGLGSGDLTNGLALGGLTNGLGGLTGCGLGDLINDVLAALDLDPSCGGGLDPLLSSLVAALNRLLDNLQICGCAKNTDVVNALMAALPGVLPARAVRREHVNFL